MHIKATQGKKPFYKILYIQVLFAIGLGVVLGHWWPTVAVEMKPLGDGFIKLIKMVIALVIFCTVVSGISGMGSMKKVGRVGGKALLYFEVVSTVALVIGLVVGNWLHPGAGFGADPASLDAKAVAVYAGKAQEQTVAEFLLNVIPNTVVDAFARGDILPVVLVSLLFGYVLSTLGNKAKPVKDVIDAGSALVFGSINVLMRLAPIGAFGAMAFTVGRYGVSALGPLFGLVATFYLTSLIFVIGVLGVIARWSGFSIFKFLHYIREEILIVLGTSSSDPALPSLMQKLERLGCSRPVVGLVVPTGYVFNTDGSSIYMTLAALFVAQATGTELTLTQQLAIFAVAM
jgi:aerobic C4-dicarboxylate transport protein